MKNKYKWKAVLQYVAGGLVLAASVAFAIFFPQWYGKLQAEALTVSPCSTIVSRACSIIATVGSLNKARA